jgi:hypothetical protein
MVYPFRARGLVCVVIVALGMALAGCDQDTEQELSAAGFEAKVADTPEKVASLQAMPPGKLVRHVKDGKNYYVFADAKQNCIFVGDEAAYQKFGQLQDAADDGPTRAIENKGAAMRWDLWGPFQRW